MDQLGFFKRPTQSKNKLGESQDCAIFFGYKYYQKRFNKNCSRYWVCRVSGCSGSITTLGNKVIKVNNEPFDEQSPLVLNKMMEKQVEVKHTHAKNADEDDLAAEDAVDNMIYRVQSENVSVGTIFREERKKLVIAMGSEEAAAKLPSYRSIQSTLYNKKHLKFPELPKTLQDFKIEGKWAKSLVGERDLLV
jgi:hypothetical protein